MSLAVAEIQELIADSLDWRGRRKAAIELGWLADDAALEMLFPLLHDPVRDVRQAAVVAIGRCRDPRALRELVVPKILSAQNPVMRLSAVIAIGQLGETEVLPWIAEKLGDPDWLVSLRAEEIFSEKLDRINSSIDADTVQTLIRLLDLEHKEARKRIIATISRVGSIDHDQIFDALRGGSPRIQTGLIEVLGNIGYAGFVPILVDYVRKGTHYHQIASARALAKIRSTNALEGLVGALDTHHSEVAAEVTAALLQIGEPAVEVLLEALRHTNKKTYQVHIVRCLGKLHSDRAIPALVNQLSTSYSLVRTVTVEALSRLQPDAVVPPLLEIAAFRDLPIEGILSELKQDTNPHRRIRAFRALGELGSHRAVPALKVALDTCTHPEGHAEIENALCKIACNAWARAGAVRVLERLGDPRAVDAILRLVNDDSHYVRTTAVVALRRFRSERIIPVLQRVAREDPLHDVRARAFNTLGLLWTDREEILLTCIDAARDDPSYHVRAEAIRVLARYIDSRSLPVLLDRLGDERWSVRENAANALGNFGPAVVPELSALFHETQMTVVKRRVVQILERISDAASLEVLEEAALEKDLPPELRGALHNAVNAVWRRLGGRTE
jgi:HEAT repeat protein